MKNSRMLAASHENLPVFVPGWEDSTLGNMYVAARLKGALSSYGAVKSGAEQLEQLVSWYEANSSDTPIGFLPNRRRGKLHPSTPNFVIESDATIVFPLVAAYLFDWQGSANGGVERHEGGAAARPVSDMCPDRRKTMSRI